MKYLLMANSNKGVLIDRTPILQDMRDTYTVSFLLPDTQPYIALFTGADCIEHKKAIIDGQCKIPKELLTKEQYVQLIVCKLYKDNIVQSWECEPIKITAFLHMRKTQWEVSGGMTDKDCYNRLVELEKHYSDTLGKLTELEVVKALTDTLKAQNKALADNYNNAIAVINDLSLRVAALEKNYDPTLIK